MIIALLLSCRAPATISDADADPPFTRIIRGFPSMMSPFLASKDLIFSLNLGLFVETISPSSKNILLTSIACLKRPPGFLLRSSI